MKNLIERLWEESLYNDKCTLEIMDLCMEAAEEMERLQTENTKLIAANKAVALDNRQLRNELEQVKTERDAAIKELTGMSLNCRYLHLEGYLQLRTKGQTLFWNGTPAHRC